MTFWCNDVRVEWCENQWLDSDDDCFLYLVSADKGDALFGVQVPCWWCILGFWRIHNALEQRDHGQKYLGGHVCDHHSEIAVIFSCPVRGQHSTHTHMRVHANSLCSCAFMPCVISVSLFATCTAIGTERDPLQSRFEICKSTIPAITLLFAAYTVIGTAHTTLRLRSEICTSTITAIILLVCSVHSDWHSACYSAIPIWDRHNYGDHTYRTCAFARLLKHMRLFFCNGHVW